MDRPEFTCDVIAFEVIEVMEKLWAFDGAGADIPLVREKERKHFLVSSTERFFLADSSSVLFLPVGVR